jgi:hypothetical protein
MWLRPSHKVSSGSYDYSFGAGVKDKTSESIWGQLQQMMSNDTTIQYDLAYSNYRTYPWKNELKLHI